jgi:hypothetical protein
MLRQVWPIPAALIVLFVSLASIAFLEGVAPFERRARLWLRLSASTVILAAIGLVLLANGQKPLADLGEMLIALSPFAAWLLVSAAAFQVVKADIGLRPRRLLWAIILQAVGLALMSLVLPTAFMPKGDNATGFCLVATFWGLFISFPGIVSMSAWLLRIGWTRRGRELWFDSSPATGMA